MEGKSMEHLLLVLNHQINQTSKTRFKIADIEVTELENMLWACYQAEVNKRRIPLQKTDEVLNRIRKTAKWLSGNYKPGLLMYGNTCGTGKTTLARSICSLVNYLFDSVYSGERKAVYQVTALNLAKWYTDDPALYNKFKNQEMLFIDDVGTEQVNIKIYGNEFSPVTELIYHRYDRQLFTIATSNLTDNLLSERYGERINDRLKEMFERMHFQGRSFRK